MNNEASPLLNVLLQKIITLLQLVPRYSHRRYAAERVIRTFNNHFVVILVSVDNNIHIYLWCWIVKQVEINIHVLRTPRTKPRLLVYAKIFRTIYFNAMPMAPPGGKLLHVKN